jgi:nicotinamidase-related amidase
VLHAVNLGFRVVIVEDALCSSFDAGRDALMTSLPQSFCRTDKTDQGRTIDVSLA